MCNYLPFLNEYKFFQNENSADTGAYIDFGGVIDSLQNDITDIKNQAEAAQQFIVSLEDSQETIDCLQKQLTKITAELEQTKEELERKTKGKLDRSVM